MSNNNTLLLNGFYFSVLKRVKYFYLTVFLALSTRIMYESTNLFVIVMSYPHTYPQLSTQLSTVLYDLSTSILIPFKHKHYKCIPLKHNITNQPTYNKCIRYKPLQSNTIPFKHKYIKCMPLKLTYTIPINLPFYQVYTM